MHPLAALRRQLKSRTLADIHAALGALQPEDAATILDGTRLDDDGALVLGRALESGTAALPYRTYAAVCLLSPDDPRRQGLRRLHLQFTTPEPAALDWARLGPLPALEHLSLTHAAGVTVLPALPRLSSLDLRGATGLDLPTLLSGRALHALTLARQPLSDGLLDTQAPALRSLTLLDCTGITTLPPMPALERLVVRACPDLTAPLPLADLPALRALTADMDVQAPIGAHPALTTIRLEEDGHLRGPLHLPALEALRAHTVEDESSLSISTGLRVLHLAAWSGTSLAPLAGAAGLTLLRLESAAALASLEALAGCTALETLLLGGARVEDLTPLQASATTLRELVLRGCDHLDSLDGLEGFTALRTVDLSGCQGIQQVHALRDLVDLERVVLPMVRSQTAVRYEGAELEALRTRLAEGYARRAAAEQGDPLVVRIRGLLMHGDLHHQRQALEVMRSLGPEVAGEVLGECRVSEAGELVVPYGEPSEALLVATLEAGRVPAALTHLTLQGERFGSLVCLEHLGTLEHLTLQDCSRLATLAGLERLPRLRHLELHGCLRLQDISALRWARSLETLRITGQTAHRTPLIGTAALRILSHVPYLEVLDLRGCGPLELPVIGGLTRLRELRATGLLPPDSLSRLAGLSRLEVLALEGCDKLEDLYALRQLSRLKTLILAGGVAARDLSALEGLRSLETLHIGGPRLEDADVLCALTGLQELTLENCAGLSSVKFLQALPHLRTLYLEGPQIRNLHDLQGLSALETLTLQNLPRLYTLDGLEGCAALRSLSVETGCPELQLAEALLEVPRLETLHLLEGRQFQLSPRPDERIGHAGQVRPGPWLRRLRAWLRHKESVTRRAMQDALASGEEAAVEKELADLRAFADPRLTAALLAPDAPALPEAVQEAVAAIDAGLRAAG